MLLRTVADFASSIEKVEEQSPKVQNFGIFMNNMNENNWGYDIGLNFDLSLGYTMPYYKEMKYAVSEPHVHALLGGTNWVTLGLGAFKLNFFFEVNGMHF